MRSSRFQQIGLYGSTLILVCCPLTVGAQVALIYHVPPGLAESPNMVISQFLMRRLEITGVRPTVTVCGAEARVLFDQEFIDALTGKGPSRPYVHSVHVLDSCPPTANLGAWDPAKAPGENSLMIVGMAFGPFSSSIEALSAPQRGKSEGVFASGRREVFRWDHTRAIGGQSLEFFDFRAGT